MNGKESKDKFQQENVDKKRRSLAKAGLTTPVIASLFSRPVFAQQCSGSALMSGNLSNPVDMATCGACLASQWLNATNAELELAGVLLTDGIGSVFTIPLLTKPPSAGQEILTGSLNDALTGNITVYPNLGYSNNSGPITGTSNIDAARNQLKAAFVIYVAAYLNSAHIATKVNFPFTLADVRSEVNTVLTLNTSTGSDRLNIDSVNVLAKTISDGIGNGDSCAINRTI